MNGRKAGRIVTAQCMSYLEVNEEYTSEGLVWTSVLLQEVHVMPTGLEELTFGPRGAARGNKGSKSSAFMVMLRSTVLYPGCM